MKKNSGYTLLETMITLAVMSIVTAIAVPSMTVYMQNDRIATQINALVGHLAYARSEAVTRSQQVGVCVSNNATSCTGGTNWENGWIIYADLSGNGAFNAGETVLRAQQALSGGNTLKPKDIGTQVVYDYRGYARAGSIGSFSLCDSRGSGDGKAIAISNTGRVKKEGTVTC